MNPENTNSYGRLGANQGVPDLDGGHPMVDPSGFGVPGGDDVYWQGVLQGGGVYGLGRRPRAAVPHRHRSLLETARHLARRSKPAFSFGTYTGTWLPITDYDDYHAVTHYLGLAKAEEASSDQI